MSDQTTPGAMFNRDASVVRDGEEHHTGQHSHLCLKCWPNLPIAANTVPGADPRILLPEQEDLPEDAARILRENLSTLYEDDPPFQRFSAEEMEAASLVAAATNRPRHAAMLRYAASLQREQEKGTTR